MHIFLYYNPSIIHIVIHIIPSEFRLAAVGFAYFITD